MRQGCTKPPQFKRLPLFLKHANGAIPLGLILAHLYAFVLSKCMCVFSPLLFLLCCRFIPGPNRELPSQGCVPGSSPRLHFLLTTERTKTITSTATDWITWDHRKDIHPDKTALLMWCQGFETTLIPCLINEPHVGDSPLPHSCGQFQTSSLSVSLTLSPLLYKLKQLSRGHLEVVKTLFDRASA